MFRMDLVSRINELEDGISQDSSNDSLFEMEEDPISQNVEDMDEQHAPPEEVLEVDDEKQGEEEWAE